MKLIPLTRGLFAKVSNKDYKQLSEHKWYAYRSGRSNPPLYYAGRWGPGGTKIIMHREILNARPGMDVDHRDGNTLNNQRSNLKEKTRSQNCHGYRRSDHPMTGIRKQGARFLANVCIDYKRHFKTFDTPEEAQAWRRSMKP